MLQSAFDKCNVLMDIAKATELMSDSERKQADTKASKKVPHPADVQYRSLKASLEYVDPKSAEYKQVLRALTQTSGGRPYGKLVHAWRVNREGEDESFRDFSKVPNHKLLWHGTNIAVVAAILSSGLRIMPHSGGRCGAGIYLASESGKSLDYMNPSIRRGVGCMFLAEAALGKEYDLYMDNAMLRHAPHGFDSVVARGMQTPQKFEQMDFADSKPIVPIGTPVSVTKQSAFHQDEYLVYKEQQVRLRFVLTVGN